MGHPNLIQAELNTLLPDCQIEWLCPMIAIVTASENNIERLLKKSASVKFILYSPILLKSEDLTDLSVLKTLDMNIIPFNDNDQVSFASRHFQVQNRIESKKANEVEPITGFWVQSRLPSIHVNLQNPEFKIYS